MLKLKTEHMIKEWNARGREKEQGLCSCSEGPERPLRLDGLENQLPKDHQKQLHQQEEEPPPSSRKDD